MSALLALGPHIFEIAPLNYQKLQKKSAFRHAEMARLAREPARQFVGPGSATVSISGLMFPDSLGGYEEYRAVERTARTGRPLMMVGGTGLVFGRVVILSVSETHQVIGARGAPAKLEFSIEVASYGDDLGGIFTGLF